MNDRFYIEVTNITNSINRILNGNDIKEKISVTSKIKDAIDGVLEKFVIAECDSVLDLLMNIEPDDPDTEADETLDDMIADYVNLVEMERLKGRIGISDNDLIDKYLINYYSKCSDGAFAMAILVYIMGIISIKNKDSLEEAHEKIMSIIPGDIKEDYNKERRFKRIQFLELRKKSGIISDLYTGSFSVPKSVPGYETALFVEDSINDMTDGLAEKIANALSDPDLVNILDALSGNARKKLLENMSKERALQLSKKVVVFSFLVDSAKEGIFTEDEVNKDFTERILISLKNAEIIIKESSKR